MDIPVVELLKGEEIGGWYDVIVKEKRSKKITEGQVHFFAKFIPATDTLNPDVDDSYFPQTYNNQVTLYQDADTPPLSVFRGVVSEDGGEYVPTRCWSDLYDALTGAQKLIYITGWSVNSEIHLVRDEDEETGRSKDVGTLLKEKAEQGVTVLVMTWNDRSNDGTLDNLLTKGGMMGTHDEETMKYFSDSKVTVANVPRQKLESWKNMAGQFTKTCYTHHQKTVIVDTDPLPDSSSDQRRLVAFVGGLDITDGRYDTPEFPLFSTLRTLHKDDFYQNCTPGATPDSGPREPWHDIHAKLEGPAVKFIMQNFMERWTMQADEPDKYSLMALDEFDLDAHGHSDLEDGWSVRVLRSITQDSAKFDEERHGVLHSKYGILVDNSIEKTYIKLIRAAKSFIYIENQYFLGSAFTWFSDADRGTDTQHTIPIELIQRIVKSIETGTEFKVYICIPMFPEGDPKSQASQEILYWQHCTMQAMYKRVAAAIEKMDSGKHPQDYLNFFCLGKRETQEEVPEYLDTPEDDSPAEMVRKSLRHPIYVHSKLMIVDDVHIVLGSANINQRSLDGNRDSEICMHGFQPGSNMGGVHVFREALWSAHLGGYVPGLSDPGSDECLAEVRRVSRENWEVYTAEEPPITQTNVHLLPYPVSVTAKGEVKPLEKPFDNFPDTKASVIGKKSGMLPAKLTT